MTMRVFAVAGMMMVAMTAGAAAQPAPAPAPARAVEPAAPSQDQPNIQFDITVSDEGGGFPASKKSVVLMVQGGGAGSLRSNGIGSLRAFDTRGQPRAVEVVFNIDVKLPRYEIKDPNKVRARVTIEYQPFHEESPKGLPGRVRAQVDVALENGRKTMLWQTADPVTGLRSTIEVTATVLK